MTQADPSIPSFAESIAARQKVLDELAAQVRSRLDEKQNLTEILPEVGVRLDPQTRKRDFVRSGITRVWATLFGRSPTGCVLIGAGEEGGQFTRPPDLFNAVLVLSTTKVDTTVTAPDFIPDYWEISGQSDTRPTLWAVDGNGVDRGRLAPDTLTVSRLAAATDLYLWTRKIWAKVPQFRVQATNPSYQLLAVQLRPLTS